MKSAVASVSIHEITKDISAQEAEVPHEIRVRQTSMNRFQRQFVRTDPNNRGLRRIQKAHLKNIVTSPAHKEVFKIRVRRNALNGNIERKMHPIRDINLEKSRDGHAWDIFDVMQHVRYSFFGKLFEDEIKKNEFSPSVQKGMESMKLPKLDPGLFETVKSTLSSLQETSDPFLMVIFGGHLSEIGDPHSALVQSVKHVTESTNPENTLIVLTTSCPETSGADHPEVIQIDENPALKHQRCQDFPVFAKGPKSDKLSYVAELHEIPAAVKDALQEISPNFGGNQEGEPRNRRSVLSEALKTEKSSANYVRPISFGTMICLTYALFFN
ncbi:unnamed protein product [Acanthoscelides obtectus]|nr:unnamed protein product [Acanthoscelides obtectus]CAK1626758.1 hypothetical protein AOBTE_LOCUS4059 [Acanthoscelides obtectus]